MEKRERERKGREREMQKSEIERDSKKNKGGVRKERQISKM